MTAINGSVSNPSGSPMAALASLALLSENSRPAREPTALRFAQALIDVSQGTRWSWDGACLETVSAFSHDLIGYKGGINLYEYVKDNPMGFTDPGGLYVQGCICKSWGEKSVVIVNSPTPLDCETVCHDHSMTSMGVACIGVPGVVEGIIWTIEVAWPNDPTQMCRLLLERIGKEEAAGNLAVAAELRRIYNAKCRSKGGDEWGEVCCVYQNDRTGKKMFLDTVCHYSRSVDISECCDSQYYQPYATLVECYHGSCANYKTQHPN
jgi:hypothetical protein